MLHRKRTAVDAATLATAAWLLFVGLEGAASAQTEVQLQPEAPRFRIELPDVLLTDVPVRYVRIVAQNADGQLDAEFDGRPLIEGIRLIVKGRDTALPGFEHGILELTTDLPADRKVYVTSNEIVVDPEARRPGYLKVNRIFRWVGLIPPMVAIVLAVWLRNVYVALFAAVYSGAVILAHGDFFGGLLRTLDTYVLDELVQSGSEDKSHMLIILFTMLLGAMVGVMSASGSTSAMVDRLAGLTRKREHGQLMTWFLGLVVFFDDYANSLLVGTSMRSVCDRLKISREKLAFLVDSTAAPVAGIAIVSTWVGFEIGQIDKAFEELSSVYAGANLEWDSYTAFLASLPYRFYPLQLLVFVWLIAYSGHDFGPMLKAETQALARPAAETPLLLAGISGGSPIRPKRQLMRNAIVPLVALLALNFVGLWWSGSSKIALEDPSANASVWKILGAADGTRVLFVASFVASALAVALVVVSRSLTLNESIEAWIAGAKSMFPPLVILVLAWGIATVCDGDHLNTAGFLVELSHGRIAASWMPALVFILSAIVSFATGSSFSTMGLLMPLSISVTFNLLVPLNEGNPGHHLMSATIGAVLAGAIFGDHCSPISDTTILSSAAADCDHLEHVATQLPYAGTVALVSLLLGYVPIGFGVKQTYVLLPLGMLVLYVIVMFWGRSVADYAKLHPASPADAPPLIEDSEPTDDASE